MDTKEGIMCQKEIELHAQNLLTILGFIVNIIGGPVMSSKMALTLIMNEIYIYWSKNYEGNSCTHDLELAIIQQ
jgi:hypothetical protein